MQGICLQTTLQKTVHITAPDQASAEEEADNHAFYNEERPDGWGEWVVMDVTEVKRKRRTK